MFPRGRRLEIRPWFDGEVAIESINALFGPPMPRPRFQFRLRTLFVVVTMVAVACGYVGSQWKIVRARRAFRESHPLVAFVYPDAPDSAGLPLPHWNNGWRPTDVGLLRKFIGDQTIAVIYDQGVGGQTDMQTVKTLFPEARCTLWVDREVNVKWFPAADEPTATRP